MRPRRRWFVVYVCTTLLALIFLSAAGGGDWGVAHGQTAPGHHPGARAAEATPGPPGTGGTGADRLAEVLPPLPMSATSVIGFALTAVGLGLIVASVIRNFQRRRARPPTSSRNGGPGATAANGEA